ncbi:MAG TPA: ABC transporter substrate-binding protein [Coleofasciculaceae cyanobacterium]
MTKRVGFQSVWFRTTAGIAAFLGMAIAFSACQRLPSSAHSEVKKTPTALNLGVLLPATGNLSAVGEPVLQVLPLITNTINACGGVNDAPVNLVVEDEQPDPKAQTEVVRRLAASQVSAIVGGFVSDAATAAEVTAAVQHKIPLISPSNTSPIFTEQAKKGNFRGFWGRTIPADTTQAIALAQLAKSRGFNTVATLVVNDSNGIRFEQAFAAAFKQLGGTILNQANPTRYDPQESNFDEVAVAAFNPAGKLPDAVVADLNPSTGSLLLQSAYNQGLVDGVQLMLKTRVRNSTFTNSAFIEEVGQAPNGKFLLEGAIGTAPSVESAVNTNFLKLWKQKQNTPPEIYVSQTWDAIALLTLAAQAAKSNNGEAIKNKLRQVANAPGVKVTDICEALQRVRDGQDIDYQGVSGAVDLNENGDVVSDYDIWTVDTQGKVRKIGQVKLKP